MNNVTEKTIKATVVVIIVACIGLSSFAYLSDHYTQKQIQFMDSRYVIPVQ